MLNAQLDIPFNYYSMTKRDGFVPRDVAKVPHAAPIIRFRLRDAGCERVGGTLTWAESQLPWTILLRLTSRHTPVAGCLTSSLQQIWYLRISEDTGQRARYLPLVSNLPAVRPHPNLPCS